MSFDTYPPMKMEQSVSKRRHIKFRRRGITQKKTYNMGKWLLIRGFIRMNYVEIRVTGQGDMVMWS